MSRLRRAVALALIMAACASTGVLLAPGLAAATSPAVADCNAHSRLTAQYTATQLRGALATMPADVKEYTDCYDVIQRVLLADLGGTHVNGAGSGGSGGSFLPVPVLIVLGVLVVTAAGYGIAAARRRGSNPGEGPSGPPGERPSGPPA